MSASKINAETALAVSINSQGAIPADASPAEFGTASAGVLASLNSPPVHHEPEASFSEMKCCYPIGKPLTVSFRFCKKDVLAGKAFCDIHAPIVYVRICDDRGDIH